MDDQDRFEIASSPHASSGRSNRAIMCFVILALMPNAIVSIYFFKWMALRLYAACCLGSVAAETIGCLIRRKKVTAGDGSAVVTGLLLAMVLPPSLPIWCALLGSIVAILLSKEIFGGLGQNIFNPALVGRAFLMASFPALLTSWTKPITLEAVTRATPLALSKFEAIRTPMADLFIGNISGSLGETSALAIIIGGLFLLIKRAADWRIPAGFIGVVILFGGLLNLANPSSFPGVDFQLFAGGLMLGAFFMATDPVTSPITKKGRWIFGLGCGTLVVIIRAWGGLPEGVMYSILLMNAITPLINRYTRPRRFGFKIG
ncbi:MAG: RnfABCDGE type electron transport complex subunit D [Candidatus Omnitrophica bacterium]|nr:RnfABCDGE type electron transport complex subunit D [Candidatus Omnitrophota bacterium]